MKNTFGLLICFMLCSCANHYNDGVYKANINSGKSLLSTEIITIDGNQILEEKYTLLNNTDEKLRYECEQFQDRIEFKQINGVTKILTKDENGNLRLSDDVVFKKVADSTNKNAEAVGLLADSNLNKPQEQQEAKLTYNIGSLCTGDNQFSRLTYKREYKHEGNNFITVYKISSSENGYYLNITATHNKSKKNIIISVDDITVDKQFGHISTQKMSYKEPSLEVFGRTNIFKANGMDAQGRLPNNLELQFTGGAFENINVINIVRDDQIDATKWYVLDKEM